MGISGPQINQVSIIATPAEIHPSSMVLAQMVTTMQNPRRRRHTTDTAAYNQRPTVDFGITLSFRNRGVL